MCKTYRERRAEQAREFAEAAVGKEEMEVRLLITTADCHCRVTMRDGQARPVTQDVRPERVNLHVVNGVVVKAYAG